LCGDVVQAPVESLASNVSNLLDSALGSYDTDKVFAIVGATSGLLSQASANASTGGTDQKNASASMRENLLSTVSTVTGILDVSVESVNQQATIVSSLTAAPDELTDGAKSTALGLVFNMTSASGNIGIPPSTGVAVGSSLSSLLAANSTYGNSDSTALLSGTVDNLALGGTVGLAPGEVPFSVQADNLNLSSQVTYPSGVYQLLDMGFRNIGRNS